MFDKRSLHRLVMLALSLCPPLVSATNSTLDQVGDMVPRLMLTRVDIPTGAELTMRDVYLSDVSRSNWLYESAVGREDYFEGNGTTNHPTGDDPTSGVVLKMRKSDTDVPLTNSVVSTTSVSCLFTR
jgi:hypothetical protein